MKCLICNRFSLSLFCLTCQEEHLKPTVTKRILSDGLEVFSFYKYSEIQDFIKTKHTYHGQKIYKALAKNSFCNFAKDFFYEKKVYALPVDDKLTSNYSHTAILAHALNSKNIKPLFKKLRAKNTVSYSTKTLEFRLKNPRDFDYTFKKNIDVILVDDIVTTGTTLSEAKALLQNHDVNVLFALTLADARQ